MSALLVGSCALVAAPLGCANSSTGTHAANDSLSASTTSTGGSTAPGSSTTAPTSQPSSQNAAHYPCPYKAPTVAQITEVLERVRNRIDIASTPRFVERKTRREIDDVSQPIPNVGVDAGPDGEFNPMSYPMGVIQNGMINAAQATGDSRFNQFTAKWFQFYADNLPVLSKWPRRTLAPPVATQPSLNATTEASSGEQASGAQASGAQAPGDQTAGAQASGEQASAPQGPSPEQASSPEQAPSREQTASAQATSDWSNPDQSASGQSMSDAQSSEMSRPYGRRRRRGDGSGGGGGGGPRYITNPFRTLLAPNSLDDCGAMTSAMIKARMANVGPDLLPVIQRAVNFVSHRQFRLPDGTLARRRPVANSIWADDMFMGVSVLAQAGKMTGDTRYYDDAAKQVLQIGAHLYVPSEQLFTHGWNSVNPDDHPTYFWGRANGWCMMAMAELLAVLPEDHPDRPAVLRQFRTLAQGIASVQGGDGLWHQMLNRTDSYTETSCSAMFTFAFARGVDRGWLDFATYGPVAQAGWNGLQPRIDKDGHITGTCVGTSYANDYIYYYHRPEIDDVHAYGPVLLAGAEMIHLMKNKKFTSSNGIDGTGNVSFSAPQPHTRRSTFNPDDQWDIPDTEPATSMSP